MSTTGNENGSSTLTTAAGTSDFNPYLASYCDRRPDPSAGVEQLFESGDRELIAWQTRAAVPSEFEIALAAALQQIFTQQIYDLTGIVTALNRTEVRTSDGEIWTESKFQHTMRELGRLAIGAEEP